MPSEIVLAETIILGSPITLECPSPKTSYSVVFEDDGETGMLYGLDHEKIKQPVLDSLLIYNVQDILDQNVSVKVEILWSEDGLKSCLAINSFKHAIFDFESKKAYCRTNLPAPDRRFTNSHKWNDTALDLFT